MFNAAAAAEALIAVELSADRQDLVSEPLNKLCRSNKLCNNKLNEAESHTGLCGSSTDTGKHQADEKHPGQTQPW